MERMEIQQYESGQKYEYKNCIVMFTTADLKFSIWFFPFSSSSDIIEHVKD